MTDMLIRGSVYLGVSMLCVIALAAIGRPQGLRAEPAAAPVDWRRAYIGANVYVGGKLCTVTNSSVSPYGEYAEITFGDGKHLLVDWAVVTRQVDAACAKSPRVEN